MNFKDQMAVDAAVFFNAAEFGEAATYNGDPVTVVPEIGATLQPGNTIDTDGSSDRALFWVKAADVASPESGDVIEHNAKTWDVIRIVATDSAAHCLECIGARSPYRLGR